MRSKTSTSVVNKYKKLTINIIVLTFILTGGISTPAFAASSENKGKNQENTNREIAILESFEENDYNAWKKYIGKNSNLAEYISEEKFSKFIEIRNLARNAHHDEALTKSEQFEKELKADLKKFSNTIDKQAKLLPFANKAELAIAKIEAIKIKAEKNIT